MTEKFKKCIPVILKHEGGFVNHEFDPGGATNFGISLRWLKSLDATQTGELPGDINKDGEVNQEDIKKMTKKQAEFFYFVYFWKNQFEAINNDEAALHLFDMSVNAGVPRAVKLAQKVSGAKQDGIIGPKTVASINNMGDAFTKAYQRERCNFYKYLARRTQKFNIFLNGWLNRVETTNFES